jgi:hypothetical protein
MNKTIPYIAIAVLLLYIFGQSFFSRKPIETVKRDTVIKVIEIPEKTGTFTNSNPQPIYISQPVNDKQLEYLYSKIADLQDENQKVNYLLSQLSTKTYNKTYSDKDVSITVTDTVSGKLLNQDVKWTIKPQKVEVKEVTITKQVKPKFTLSVGGGVRFNPINQQVYGVLGLKNAKGYELQLGVDTDKTYFIGVKKDLISKF